MRFKKRILAVAASAMMGVAMVSGTCMSANAATGKITAGNGYGTLTNNTSSSRYASIRLQVIDRSTGSTARRTGNEGVISGYASISTSASGYSAVNYRFYTYGSLFTSTSSKSSVYWSGNATY